MKYPRSLLAQTGWLVTSNKIGSATRAYKEATRPLTNHPGRCAASPPLKGGEWTRLATNPFPVSEAYETNS